MTRKYLTGLLLAASTMTLGAVAVVQAQDESKPAAGEAGADAPEKHDHEHTPTTIHAKDGSVFELGDTEAYPDPDGFESMKARTSYAIARYEGMRLQRSPQQLAQLREYDVAKMSEAMTAALAEEDRDVALGTMQALNLVQQLKSSGEEVDMEAFLKGFVAAFKIEDPAYAQGYTTAFSLKEQDIELDVPAFAKGIKEVIDHQKALAAAAEAEEPPAELPEADHLLSNEKVDETLQAFSHILQERATQKSIEEGQAYIDNLLDEEGWKKTESGIAYKVVQEGEGASPDENDIAEMHYEGTLIDGTVFDSSYKRGQTLSFAPNQVIEGWKEIMQVMKPGSIYEVAIPYDLAYGEQGSPPNIPGYSTLRFKMEMIGFKESPNPPAPKPKAPKPEAEKPAADKPAE